MVIPHLKTGTSELWVDTTLSAMITHNDSGSIAACVAFVRLLWDLLGSRETPAPEWWVETYVETARALELETYTPRGGDYLDFEGPIWVFVRDKVRDAHKAGLPTLDACNSWYSGAFLLETVPSALYILMRHGDDPEEAIVRAVNDTRDNDTIAAIVGAAVGALHGKKGLPSRWAENLLGRTTKDDDGKIFQILDEARELWWAT
jgi:ADP-ribosylglycohydrolase